MLSTQCKMARAALGWTVLDLANKSGVNKNTIVNFEKGKDVYQSTVLKLRTALENSGSVTISDDGCVCTLQG